MDNTEEIWKNLSGLGFNKYDVSNLGRVRSHNQYGSGKDVILKQSKTRHGYFQVSLYNKNGVSHCRVNRLVALTFLADQCTDNTTDVCHLDNNKQNNVVTNLCFKDHKTNCRMSIQGRKVYQYSMDGKLINTFDYIVDAATEAKCSSPCIRNHCINGKPFNGFYWSFEEHNKIN